MDKIIAAPVTCHQGMSGKIRFLPLEKICAFRDEQSVLEVALENGIEIPHSCGAMGSCTTCRVFVVQSAHALPPRNELEQDIADMREFRDDERLSCQLPPLDGLVVRLPIVDADT
jgi:ferredoxin